jgi:hypothetical protein
MDDQRTDRNGGSLIGAAFIAVPIAILLLMFWQGSAREAWSSDAWLENTYIIIALAGPTALLLLPIAIWWRRRK